MLALFYIWVRLTKRELVVILHVFCSGKRKGHIIFYTNPDNCYINALNTLMKLVQIKTILRSKYSRHSVRSIPIIS